MFDQRRDTTSNVDGILAVCRAKFHILGHFDLQSVRKRIAVQCKNYYTNAEYLSIGIYIPIYTYQ